MRKLTLFFKRFVYLSIIGMAVVVSSCSDNPLNNKNNNNHPVPQEFKLITTHMADQYKYTVYALDSLETEYNKIYIAVENSQGNTVEVKDPDVIPLMHMGHMMHSAPVSDVETVKKMGRTYLKVGVSFIMASMGSSYWTLKVEGQTNGTTIEEQIRVKVIRGDLMAVKKVNGRKYYLTYVGPKTPVVGGDTYEVALYYMEGMMSFPPVTEATVKIDPFMDMGSSGHGPASYDEVATHLGDGHYQGNINYSMAGQWQLTFTAELKNGTQITFDTFEIMVER